jgi:hypothetical protein
MGSWTRGFASNIIIHSKLTVERHDDLKALIACTYLKENPTVEVMRALFQVPQRDWEVKFMLQKMRLVPMSYGARDREAANLLESDLVIF